MELELKYILAAIAALHEAYAALANGTPTQRGRAMAHCTMAAIELEVQIGYEKVEVTDAVEA